MPSVAIYTPIFAPVTETLTFASFEYADPHENSFHSETSHREPGAVYKRFDSPLDDSPSPYSVVALMFI